LGVIGADVHAVGNQLLEHVLKERGIDAKNIGVMSSQKDFIEAAMETGADAIWVSSLYGHAEMDCRGLPQKCIESGIPDILIYLGGNLALGKQSDKEWKDIKKRYENMGFDRVYPPQTNPKKAIDDLFEDLR